MIYFVEFFNRKGVLLLQFVNTYFTPLYSRVCATGPLLHVIGWGAAVQTQQKPPHPPKKRKKVLYDTLSKKINGKPPSSAWSCPFPLPPFRKTHLSLFDFLFLLFQKSWGDAGNVLLGAQQQGPEVLHKLPGVLPVQKACQVDLHHLAIRVLQHTHEGRREKKKNVAIEILEDQTSRGGRVPQTGLPTFYSSINLYLRLFR